MVFVLNVVKYFYYEIRKINNTSWRITIYNGLKDVFIYIYMRSCNILFVLLEIRELKSINLRALQGHDEKSLAHLQNEFVSSFKHNNCVTGFY